MKILTRLAMTAALCLAAASPAPASTPSADTSTLGPAPDEQRTKADAEAAGMKAQLQRAKDAVNAAKKPEDLDPVLFDLQKYQNGGGISGIATENQGLYQQLALAAEFTKQWQNYLSHLSSGETEQARNDLSALSQGNYGLGILPRSRILALLAGTATANTAASNGNLPTAAAKNLDYWGMIQAMNSLDDLGPTRDRLNELAANDAEARAYVDRLQPMLEVYDDLRQGLPTSVSIDFLGGTQGAGANGKINALLLKFIFTHYFDTYKGAAPSDAETPAAYVERVKTDALAGQDWMLLKRALTAHAYLFRNVTAAGGGPDNESAGLDDLITGINQEDAGQYALAVASYQNALKAGSLDIPAKFIGERLDAIKRGHPTEYDSGMASFLTPSMPPYYPGMNPAMYNPMTFPGRFRPGMPGFPGGPPAPPSPVITIPAAKPNTNPAPAPATNAPAAANP